MSGTHSILPPSGAAAWRRCPMWVTMNQRYPKPDTPESQEGTAAHWVFGEMLAGRPMHDGLQAPNGVYVTAEMIEGGELVCDVVAARGLRNPRVEVPVRCNYIHAQCWGTPDLSEYLPDQWCIEILDYKFGHKFVDEFENDQGIAYSAGLLEELDKTLDKGSGLIDQSLKINFTVIQPRCFYKGSSVRTWSFMAHELRTHINLLATAAAKALEPNPVAITNAECGYCPGRHTCPALQQAAYSDAEFAVMSAPVELSPTAASLELKMLQRAQDRLDARVEGLREAVLAMARQGHRVPWHKVTQGDARTIWTHPPEDVIAVGQLMGVDIAKPGVLTPKQAAKAGIDDTVIKAYSITPPGAFKLEPDSPADARRVFGIT